jgi:hypothetical protein
LGEHAARETLELVFTPGSRERGVTHVVRGLEVRVVDPHWPTLSEGDEAEPLAITRHEMETTRDRLDELVVFRRRTLEDRAPGDVHVRRVAFEMKK